MGQLTTNAMNPHNCSFFHSVLICNLLGKDCANHHRSRRPMLGEKTQSASIRINVHIDDDLAEKEAIPQDLWYGNLNRPQLFIVYSNLEG